jgi:hypothetical protein
MESRARAISRLRWLRVALGKLFAKPLVPAHAAFGAAAWKRLTRHISCPFLLALCTMS